MKSIGNRGLCPIASIASIAYGIGVYAYCLIAEAVEQIIGRRIERRDPGRPLKNEPEG